MKKVGCSLSILILLLSAASPALAQEADSWTVNVVTKVEDGRAFREQGFMLRDGLTIVGDVTACHDSGFCADWWRAQTDENIHNETDLTVWWTVPLGDGITLQPNVAFFEIPEIDDVWRGRLTLAIQANDYCKFSANADVLRGGFESEVGRVLFDCGFPAGEDFSIQTQVGAAHDTFFDRTSVLHRVGLTRQFGHWTAGAYYEGFANDKESDGVAGFSLAYRFE